MRALTLAFAALVLVLGVAFTGEARAQVPTHTVRAELGLSFTLSDPHRDLYGLGGGGGLGYEYRLHDYVGLEGHFGAYFFASDADAVDFGSVYALSVGARIHPLPELELVDLYGSVRAAFAITGGANSKYSNCSSFFTVSRWNITRAIESIGFLYIFLRVWLAAMPRCI